LYSLLQVAARHEFPEELNMPARLAQQEDENKVGRAILRASPGQPGLPSQRAQVTAVTRARSTFAQF
jgi:hypothetical protein